jgi:transcription antitermination factor NusG
VLQTQGVISFVGTAARAEPIPDEEIESLRTVLLNSSTFVCHPYLKEGMLVDVIQGPLRGVRGRLLREARGARLVLSITLIQRAVAIEIDADNVAPVSDNLNVCLAR